MRLRRPLGTHAPDVQLAGPVVRLRCSEITMVDEMEPGMPLVLSLTVLDQASGQPLEGVVVEFVHVDSRGLYQPSDLDQKEVSWNPRLFGFCKSGEDGRVSVRTIRPAHYHSHYDSIEPAHVHFTITHDGYRTWGGEIFFEDDPLVTAEVRQESARAGTPVANAIADENGVLRADVSVQMQPQ